MGRRKVRKMKQNSWDTNEDEQTVEKIDKFISRMKKLIAKKPKKSWA